MKTLSITGLCLNAETRESGTIIATFKDEMGDNINVWVSPKLGLKESTDDDGVVLSSPVLTRGSAYFVEAVVHEVGEPMLQQDGTPYITKDGRDTYDTRTLSCLKLNTFPKADYFDLLKSMRM